MITLIYTELTPVSITGILYSSRENLIDSIIDIDFPNSTFSILHTSDMVVICAHKEHLHF